MEQQPDTTTPAKAKPFNRYVVGELNKFLHKEVVVDYVIGDMAFRAEGRMAVLCAHSGHCVIDTDEEAIFIRHPLRIARARKHLARVPLAAEHVSDEIPVGAI